MNDSVMHSKQMLFSLWLKQCFWMMHLYSALLCIAVHPKRFTIMGGGGGCLSSSVDTIFSPFEFFFMTKVILVWAVFIRFSVRSMV